MTIRRGEDWGGLHPLPPGTASLVGNRALFDHLNGEPVDMTKPVLIVGSDLAKTCGGASGDTVLPTPGQPRPLLSLDLGVVSDSARSWRFASHCVIAPSIPRLPPRPWQRWWRGEITVIMNAQFHGSLDLAPRSHPNDGRLDATTFTTAMTVRQRWAAWHRMPLGTHLPHPQIVQQRITSATTFSFVTPRSVILDGVPIGEFCELVISIMPDAFTAFV